MLVIIETSSSDGHPQDALAIIDEAMKQFGFKKEIRSVVLPGRSFSTSYEGPELEPEKIRSTIQPILEKYKLQGKVEAEESVHFP